MIDNNTQQWPPPPRPTPIIVPSHLTSTTDITQHTTQATSPDTPPMETANVTAQSSKSTKGKPTGRQKSSLHRAVMERLEVQKAMNDLVGDHNMNTAAETPK